jgi:hypothetical protein
MVRQSHLDYVYETLMMYLVNILTSDTSEPDADFLLTESLTYLSDQIPECIMTFTEFYKII